MLTTRLNELNDSFDEQTKALFDQIHPLADTMKIRSSDETNTRKVSTQAFFKQKYESHLIKSKDSLEEIHRELGVLSQMLTNSGSKENLNEPLLSQRSKSSGHSDNTRSMYKRLNAL